ncbi:MAG: GNAT family N-acetyltransferase [Eubacteriales bacterium]|nr:GNAT family N-acetyltransferase [Eubacteriales bacterium]MDD4768593.1 GNAT family N-acetyltransferase [Eubacteriales bacterium]
MKITIRLEQGKDYRAVEELTREAFWGSMNPTCDGEHLLVHKLRDLPSFVPELDFVAEAEGQLAGHIIYSAAKVITPDGGEIAVLSFGPLSVLPEYKRTGVGSALMRRSISEAKKLGYRAIIIYGHPDYYPRFGFNRASAFGITSENGKSFDALMAMPLYDGALDCVSGRFVYDAVYDTDPKEVEEFDNTFPPKEPVVLPPIKLLTAKLPANVKHAIETHKIEHVSQLQGYSGVEMLRWEGVEEQNLVQINHILKELGQPEKLLPSSYILQLAQMGVRMPVVKKIREKAGIAVYRVESEAEHYVLKVFENPEDRREIENYKILASLCIPTLPMLKHTACALLLPDVESSREYRLGCEGDLADIQVATAIAKWYKELHRKGRTYMRQNNPALYDETDKITISNLEMVAGKTNTAENALWPLVRQGFAEIRRRIVGLPHTLTYNDFYWTNLVVARDQSAAMMLDFNLLGKGYAYSDLRNVTSSLSPEAADAFMREYGEDFGGAEEKTAHGFLAPLVALVIACERESFPRWAEPALEELKSGAILDSLSRWLK